MSTVDNKIIPNQLNIIINTSVPGYQKIEYKPYMTIPDISKDDKKIMFNPLFKLNKSYVDKVPENLRKKQFFNKGLFDSLLNFTNGTKAESLIQATRNGFIDNNIKITLDSIFPENSVLYINKNPYTIADVQWSKGNWKIDTKIKKTQLDISKITDPVLYQTVVKDEIISGENQLQSLPPILIYGANYTGPKENTIVTSTRETSTASGVVPPPPSPLPPPPPPPPSVSSSTKNVIPPISNSTSTALTIKNEPFNVDEYREPIRLLTDIDSDDNKGKTTEKLPYVIESQTRMVSSVKTTANLRNFLRQQNFFNLINMIYSGSSENIKMVIQQSLSDIMPNETNINQLNRQVYLKNVLEIKTIKNVGQGNCFFIAVADGINYHNYYNQKNRIISGIFGTSSNLYTQAYLRGLVFNYLQTWDGLDDYLLNIAPVNAEELNNLFIQQLNGIKLALRESGRSDEIAPDAYVRIANDIFNSRDNFLVMNIDRVPFDIGDDNTPFKVLEKEQIERYILSSNFWANEIVIYALCSKLQLNVIPLESVKSPTRKNILRVPFANFYSNLNPNLNSWNKYLFLYYYQNHYELITFNQKKPIQKINTSGRINKLPVKNFLKKSKIIFDRNDNISELPPIYILLTIFGSYFSSIMNNEDKLNFTFKKEIMLRIQDIINNILYNRPDYRTYFYPTFKMFFPNSNIRRPINSIKGSEIKAIEPLKGGYNPYYRPTYYNQQYMAHNMERKDKEDESQLAYVITIDMELRPGTSLAPEEFQNAKCNSKWNSVRKSWSELTGNPYVIPPLYNKTIKNTEETPSNKTQNTRPEPQNNTRKYIPFSKGGNHNKTVKLY